MSLAFILKPAIAEVEEAWEAEIERRLAEYDRGEVRAIDAEEVFVKARKIAQRSRKGELTSLDPGTGSTVRAAWFPT